MRKRDLLDLKIPLSPSQIRPVRIWVRRFVALEEHWVRYPKIKHNLLTISAICFPFFMAYVNASDSNEFDIRSLRVKGERAIEELLMMTMSPSARRSYEQALDNLQTIKTGEFLVEDSPFPISLMDLY